MRNAKIPTQYVYVYLDGYNFIINATKVDIKQSHVEIEGIVIQKSGSNHSFYDDTNMKIKPGINNVLVFGEEKKPYGLHVKITNNKKGKGYFMKINNEKSIKIKELSIIL